MQLVGLHTFPAVKGVNFCKPLLLTTVNSLLMGSEYTSFYFLWCRFNLTSLLSYLFFLLNKLVNMCKKLLDVVISFTCQRAGFEILILRQDNERHDIVKHALSLALNTAPSTLCWQTLVLFIVLVAAHRKYKNIHHYQHIVHSVRRLH